MKRIKIKLYVGLFVIVIITSVICHIGMNLSDRIFLNYESLLNTFYENQNTVYELSQTLEHLQLLSNYSNNDKEYLENHSIDSLNNSFNSGIETLRNNLNNEEITLQLDLLENNYNNFKKSLSTINESSILNIEYSKTKEVLKTIFYLNKILLDEERNSIRDKNSELLHQQKEIMVFGILLIAIIFIILPMVLINPIDKLTERLTSFYKQHFNKEIEIKEDNEIKVLSDVFEQVANEITNHQSIIKKEDFKNENY